MRMLVQIFLHSWDGSSVGKGTKVWLLENEFNH